MGSLAFGGYLRKLRLFSSQDKAKVVASPIEGAI